MSVRKSLILAGVFFTAVLAFPGLSSGQGTAPSKGRPGEPGTEARNEAWGSLTEQQREKLRKALRDVWADPAVIGAREDVKRASTAYQEAIKAAVSRVDPSVADVLERVQSATGETAHEQISGRPPLGMGYKRDFDAQFRPPGFLESLPQEARDRFRKAESAALVSPPVKEAKAELEKIREEDDALRGRRMEAYRKLRKVTMDEMVRIDPSIAEVQKRLFEGERSGPSAPSSRKRDDPGKGKAPPRTPLPKGDVPPRGK